MNAQLREVDFNRALRGDSQRHVDQRMVAALPGDEIDCLRQRVVLQEFPFALSGLLFPDGPFGARAARQFSSFRATAPFLFPLRDQSRIEFGRSVRRSRLHVQRRRGDDDRKQFADLIPPASLDVETFHRHAALRSAQCARDAGVVNLSEEAWDRILDVNLKGMFLSCQQVLLVMRRQQQGCIINISSIAAVCSIGLTAYKISKAGVNALTQAMAMGNAKYGIRVNAIMPGLINTPMAIEGLAKARQMTKEDLIRERDAQVPLGGKMGTAWDVAYAALFLASDEAQFITGVVLPVDGGQSARIG